MANFIIEKKNFDMQNLSMYISEQLKPQALNGNDFDKLRLVAEEYLTNILFPNFESAVEISVFNDNNELSLAFTYKGADYMGKITDNSLLSLKILDNKTKEIKSNTKDNITSVKFIF